MFLTMGKSKYRLELRTPKWIFCLSLFSLFQGFSRIAVKVAHLETKEKKKYICAPDEAGYYTNQESIDLKCLEDQRKAYDCSYRTFSAGVFWHQEPGAVDEIPGERLHHISASVRGGGRSLLKVQLCGFPQRRVN